MVRQERNAFTRATDDPLGAVRAQLGRLLRAETDESPDEECRLKAGCSQDWLPHKSSIATPKQAGPRGAPRAPQRHLVGRLNANGSVNVGAFVEYSILHYQPAATNVTDTFGRIAFHKYEISLLPGCDRAELVFLLQKPGGIKRRDP